MIEEATIDAYNEDEQLTGLFTMIEEHLVVPFTTTVLGVEVTVKKVDLTGDNIVAGRVLSFLATLGVGAMIYACLRGMKTGPQHSLFAALLFVSGLLVFTDYVGMDDPQLLAHTVALSGLVLFLARPATFAIVTASALLMTAALFIKHNLIALPVAVTIWLALIPQLAPI